MPRTASSGTKSDPPSGPARRPGPPSIPSSANRRGAGAAEAAPSLPPPLKAPEPDPTAPGRWQDLLEATASAGLTERSKTGAGFDFGGTRIEAVALMADFPGIEPATQAARSLAEAAMAGPRLVKAKVPPTVDAAAAKKKLGGKAELTWVPAVVARCLVSVRYHGEHRIAWLGVYDLARDRLAPELAPSVLAVPAGGGEPLPAGVAPAPKVAAALAALRVAVEAAAEEATQGAEGEVAAARAARRGALSQYFAGVDAELEKEEKRVYYHLYYFDRQERLKARREAEMAERESLLKVEDRYYRVETMIEPSGLAVLMLPVYEKGPVRLSGLTGELL